jgi:hypothetical protein
MSLTGRVSRFASPAGLGFVIDVFIFYLSGVSLSPLGASRSPLIAKGDPNLVYGEEQASVTVSGFDRLLSDNATNYRRNNTRLVSSNDRFATARFTYYY